MTGPLCDATTNFKRGVTGLVVTGTPLSKTAVTEVSELIVAEELSKPRMVKTAIFPDVGKSVPVIATFLVPETLIAVIVGEEASFYSNEHYAPKLFVSQDTFPFAVLSFMTSVELISIAFVRHLNVP